MRYYWYIYIYVDIDINPTKFHHKYPPSQPFPQEFTRQFGSSLRPCTQKSCGIHRSCKFPGHLSANVLPCFGVADGTRKPKKKWPMGQCDIPAAQMMSICRISCRICRIIAVASDGHAGSFPRLSLRPRTLRHVARLSMTITLGSRS